MPTKATGTAPTPPTKKRYDRWRAKASQPAISSSSLRKLAQRSSAPVRMRREALVEMTSLSSRPLMCSFTRRCRPLACQLARKPACTIGLVPSITDPRRGGWSVRHACDSQATKPPGNRVVSTKKKCHMQWRVGGPSHLGTHTKPRKNCLFGSKRLKGCVHWQLGSPVFTPIAIPRSFKASV
jgi:hypothetical protein